MKSYPDTIPEIQKGLNARISS